MRKEIFSTLVTVLKDSGLFKKVYSGVLPAVTTVSSFPAVAVAVDKEERQRVNTSGCQFQSKLTFTLILYAKASKSAYDDKISDLIESVEGLIVESEDFNALVIDAYVSSIEQDGGVLYPYQLSELTVTTYYRK